MRARARAAAGTTARVVRSPAPTSSARAVSIRSSTDSGRRAGHRSSVGGYGNGTRLPAKHVRAPGRSLRGSGPRRPRAVSRPRCSASAPCSRSPSCRSSPSTTALGGAGWLIAGALIVAGARGRGPGRCGASRRFDDLLVVAYCGVAGIAVLNWLAGGDSSAYEDLFVLWVGAGAVHPPRRAFTHLGAMLVARWRSRLSTRARAASGARHGRRGADPGRAGRDPHELPALRAPPARGPADRRRGGAPARARGRAHGPRQPARVRRGAHDRDRPRRARRGSAQRRPRGRRRPEAA